jgi:hypothetical protein
MKKLLMLLCMLVTITGISMAQTSPKYLAAGGGFSDKGFAWGALGIPLTQDGKVISYTLWDFTPTTSIDDSSFKIGNKMLKLTTTTGAAYNMLTLSPKLTVWGMGAAGLATTGDFNSAAFKYGGFVNFKTSPSIGIMVGVGGQYDSLNKSSLDLRTGVNFYIGK